MSRFKVLLSRVTTVVFFLQLVNCSERTTDVSAENLIVESEEPTVKEASPSETLDAESILKSARWTFPNKDLHGGITKNGKETPISFFFRGNDIQVAYQDKANEEQRFHLRIKKKESALYRIANGKTLKSEKSEMTRTINDSDLAIEDLCLIGLSGKKVTLLGDEKISGQECYKIRILDPDNVQSYQISYAWITKKQKCLMRLTAYNANGKPLKQITATDFKAVDGKWRIKKIRINSIDPETNKFTGVTYLELKW